MTPYTALTTFPNYEIARDISRVLVEKKLVACVNLIPAVESIYQWEGEICQENEVLAVMKTSQENMEELEKTLVELHPYDVPELIAFEVKSGHEPYISWMKKMLK